MEGIIQDAESRLHCFFDEFGVTCIFKQGWHFLPIPRHLFQYCLMHAL